MALLQVLAALWLAFWPAFWPVAAEASEVTLIDFLNAAWANSPLAKGESLQDRASNELIEASRAKYLPRLSIEAIDSTGFPGSSSDLRVSGPMGSPFRVGAAAGVVVEQTIYDFGRIESAMAHAKAHKSLSQARLAEEKFRFLLSVGQTYLECARAKSLQQTDEELMGWAKVNLRETARFTQTGQRSVIDNSLVQTEVNALALELGQLRKLEQSTEAQMRLYGVAAGCKGLGDSLKFEVSTSLQIEDPGTLLAKARIEAAQASAQQAKAAQLPTIDAMGAIGAMEDARLVDRQNFSAGVRLAFPVWNGGEDAKREQAFKSLADFQAENLKAAQLEYAARLRALKDALDRDREALSVIEKNVEQVEKTIRLASKRYERLEGQLIDVREALKQLRQIGMDRLRAMQSVASVSLQLGILRSR